jgi:hypothetical protein
MLEAGLNAQISRRSSSAEAYDDPGWDAALLIRARQDRSQCPPFGVKLITSFDPLRT